MVPWYICPQKEMLGKPKFKGVKTVKLVLCLQGSQSIEELVWSHVW